MHSRHHKQQGAALIEFVVIAMFVLVPMYLAVQALGKFADVRSVANNARACLLNGTMCGDFIFMR